MRAVSIPLSTAVWGACDVTFNSNIELLCIWSGAILLIAFIVYMPVWLMAQRGILTSRLGVIAAYIGLTQAFVLPFLLMTLYDIAADPGDSGTGMDNSMPYEESFGLLGVLMRGGVSILLLIIAVVAGSLMGRPARDSDGKGDVII